MHNKSKKNNKCSFNEKIHAAFAILFEDYKFLKYLFDIIEFSLEKLFLFIMNSYFS